MSTCFFVFFWSHFLPTFALDKLRVVIFPASKTRCRIPTGPTVYLTKKIQWVDSHLCRWWHAFWLISRKKTVLLDLSCCFQHRGLLVVFFLRLGLLGINCAISGATCVVWDIFQKVHEVSSSRSMKHWPQGVEGVKCMMIHDVVL